MVSSLHIMMGITSMNIPLAFVAAAINPVSMSFCHRSISKSSSWFKYAGQRTRSLHASVAPRLPRAAGREGAEDNDAIHSNSFLRPGENTVIPPGFIDGDQHHVLTETVPNEVALELEPKSKDVTPEQSEQALQTRQINDNITIIGISAFLSLAVGALIKYSPPGCWRYYLAGGICASTSHAITTPIDVVKTRQQVDPSLQEKSMWQATLEIVKIGGPFALLAGLGPTFIGYLIEGGVKFGIYEATKPVTQRIVSSIATFFSYPALDSRILSLLLCGFLSGTAASLMLSPMEALRIRMVSDEEFMDKNWIDAGATMMRKEGIQSLLKGLPAMIWKQVPYTMTKNASFDLFTTWLYGAWRAMGHAVTANVGIAIPLVSALAAAVLSCISSHPGDMLLSLVNAHEGSKRTRDFAKDILNGKDGIRGFFVGIKPRFLHVLMIVTVQLMIYDFVKRLVGIAATGMG